MGQLQPPPCSPQVLLQLLGSDHEQVLRLLLLLLQEGGQSAQGEPLLQTWAEA